MTRKEYMKEYRKNHREAKKISNKKYYEGHREEILGYQSDYSKRPERVKKRNELESNPKRKEQRKEYRKNHKNEIKDYNKKWTNKNPDYRKDYEQREDIKKKRKEQRETEERIAKRKLYQEENKTKRNINQKKRWVENNEFRTRHLLRKHLSGALKRYTELGKIMRSKKYGIDYEKIIEHLKPFPENLSLYHIDHIIPLCSFNFINEDGSTNLEEVKKAFAPENHQWLLAKDNLSKAGKYDKKLSVHNKNI